MNFDDRRNINQQKKKGKRETRAHLQENNADVSKIIYAQITIIIKIECKLINETSTISTTEVETLALINRKSYSNNN